MLFINWKRKEIRPCIKMKKALSLAFLTASPYKDIPFSNLTLDNQKNFLNHLTGQSLTYYQRLHPLKTGADDPSQGPQKAKVEADSFLTYASIEYELYIQNDSQLYCEYLPS